ncbi:hypothetical protein [Bacillus alkalicellulosilyticus]|uniref:hypothetical protein n=1 Tax=Alkalihalobacterium alkalicellulosilyticum TaxID=1912214 RepID=UPI0009966A29|nr:hypothetical protein [Bacillus alkalicellulosilyticus]
MSNVNNQNERPRDPFSHFLFGPPPSRQQPTNTELKQMTSEPNAPAEEDNSFIGKLEKAVMLIQLFAPTPEQLSPYLKKLESFTKQKGS